MKKILALFLFLFIVKYSFAQLEFISYAELEDVTLKEPNLLDIISSPSISYDDLLDASLLLGGYTTDEERLSIKEDLNAFIEGELRTSYKPRKLDKSLEKIRAKIKAKYLKVFVQNASLKDALILGEYNCLHFATIYAYTLNRLDIPFYIEGDERCFYVFVGSQNKMIAVSDMQPTDLASSPAYHEQFAQMLASMKVISELDLITRNHTELYQEFEDESTTMSSRMLLASQFVLKSNLQSQRGQFEASFEYAKAANVLSPSLNTLSYALSVGYAALDNEDYTNGNVVNLIADLYTYNKALFDFNYFIQVVVRLEENLSRTSYKKAVNKLTSLELGDSAHAKVYYAYHDIESSSFFEKAILDSGYYHAKLAFEYSSRDEESELLLVNRFLAAYEQKPTDEAQLELNKLLLSFPELNENQFFQMIKLNMTLIHASKFIATKNLVEALTLLSKFEKGYQKITSDLKPEEGNILATYGALATYYFSQNKISQAKIIIDKALEFYPNNNLLIFKRNAIYGY